ncbi:hypothetical protein RclHR1_00900011 [Rhizophagus clarus]|uniref:Uncharacterized protein n=1 Tax=Rhizophagus clarus TaxID=94130 RepID=A0A2Z6SDG5_9GLOM|nr:hypothetical protein RclHR1_00900011 [Rhizophagus clarus]GES73250.1 hypothetical protein RCL_jg2296.t1 [Rhizophagus clarus]
MDMEREGKGTKDYKSRITHFGISPEEWNRLAEEDEEATKMRQNLSGIKIKYDKINQECTTRMPYQKKPTNSIKERKIKGNRYIGQNSSQKSSKK